MSIRLTINKFKKPIIFHTHPDEDETYWRNNYESKCIICDHEQIVSTYGDHTCEKCGQNYDYDERVSISLSEQQINILRKYYNFPHER